MSHLEHRDRRLVREHGFFAREIPRQKETRLTIGEAGNDAPLVGIPIRDHPINRGQWIFNTEYAPIWESHLGPPEYPERWSAGLISSRFLEEARSLSLALSSGREHLEHPISSEEGREATDVIGIRMRRYDQFNLTIPKRNVSTQSAQQFSSGTATIDENLMTPLNQEDSIALTNIQKHHFCLA